MSGKHWLLSFRGKKEAFLGLSFSATGSRVPFETVTKSAPPLLHSPSLMSVTGSWFHGNEKVGQSQ